MQDERREVARIDPLQGLLGRRRREHASARRRPADPVGEAIRGVVGPDDVVGTHDGRPLAPGGAQCLLARDLERPVGFPGDLLGLGERRRIHVVDLGRARANMRDVRRHRRDEDVPPIGERGGGLFDPARDVAAEVDDHVEGPALERLEPIGTVGVDMLCRWPRIVPTTAMEDRHLVSGL